MTSLTQNLNHVNRTPSPSAAPSPVVIVASDVYYNRATNTVSRPCPTCGNLGFVGVYRDRLDETVAHVTKASWECKSCADATEEAQRAQIRMVA